MGNIVWYCYEDVNVAVSQYEAFGITSYYFRFLLHSVKYKQIIYGNIIFR